MIIYICSPYSAKTKKEIEANIKTAKWYARIAAFNKNTVICPHLNFAFLDENNRDLIMEQCYELIKVCDEVWAIQKNGKFSEGQQLEIDLAVDLNKKIKIIKWGKKK